MLPVNIVILNHNTQPLLARCLTNLLAVGIHAEQIVVIDNASTDASRTWLESQAPPGLTVRMLDDNGGFAVGNNAGIALTTARYVLLLNTDAFPKAGAVERLVEVMEQDEAVGITGPQLLFANGSWQRSFGNVPSARRAMWECFEIPTIVRAVQARTWQLRRRFLRASDTGYVDGACMLLRKSMLDRVGALDEGFFFYGEDVEMCMRAAAFGYRVVYVPAAEVIHLRGASSSQKNALKYARIQRTSMERLIRDAYGEEEWRLYQQWLARHFRVRALLSGLLSGLLGRLRPGLAEQAEIYQEIAALYAES